LDFEMVWDAAFWLLPRSIGWNRLILTYAKNS
jgi:hypothetical protein